MISVGAGGGLSLPGGPEPAGLQEPVRRERSATFITRLVDGEVQL